MFNCNLCCCYQKDNIYEANHNEIQVEQMLSPSIMESITRVELVTRKLQVSTPSVEPKYEEFTTSSKKTTEILSYHHITEMEDNSDEHSPLIDSSIIFALPRNELQTRLFAMMKLRRCQRLLQLLEEQSK